jgi:hypothetical protein
MQKRSHGVLVAFDEEMLISNFVSLAAAFLACPPLAARSLVPPGDDCDRGPWWRECERGEKSDVPFR